VAVDDDRRTTFRAVLAETREGLLVSKGQNLRVRIVDESAGGLCVSTTRSSPFADGTELRLSTDDGDVLAVKIMHQHKAGRRTVIGLMRNGEVPPPRYDRRGTRPLILLLGITLGLYAGFALRGDTLRHNLAHIPSLKQLLIGN
jgi:hypothetical protein